MTRSRTERLAFAALLTMAAVWGSTFFLMKDLLTRVGVLDMLAVRFAIASVALALLAAPRLRVDATVLRRGVLLGLLYGAAQIVQTVGLSLTSASVSGFVTSLYVVLTPLLGALVFRSRIGAATWAGAALAAVGLGVLSLQGFSVGSGEALTLASAALYALHILVLSRFTDPERALGLSLVQLVVITLVCTGAALLPDGSGHVGVTLPATAGDWVSMLYLAVVAGAGAMVLQTWAQAHVEPSSAAVVMAAEPVWAAVFAVLLGGERPTVRMVLGGLAIVGAMYLVELAPRRSRSTDAADDAVEPALEVPPPGAPSVVPPPVP
ncbi:Permease of the drug/metabolite transporter (DMT) superfamily [Microlunatus sagamiharensis]|uniref:Permease of the drug/metabolite transporter (DMT) superfamily n=1 Tax=Microlunatus sagamiharensis TaxID=546874 RepID=A0A1H2MR18_9ACTN|nr:DMT family transporter [Microlunatus sagamiharensis]SDU95415.1 Permease of the drug/metabolite transporter (DMT) superfamily [Microlunatus sagamiharensis]